MSRYECAVCRRLMTDDPDMDCFVCGAGTRAWDVVTEVAG